MIAVSSCPVCDSDNIKTILKCKDVSVSHETFQISQCTLCELRMTNPRPDNGELDRYYQSENYISHKKQATSFIEFVYKVSRVFTLKSKLALVKKWGSGNPKTLLDYGCGTGAFLRTCNAAGLKTVGVEPSTNARQIANDSGNLDVKETLEQVTIQADIVTLWHVLEHVPDLHTTLSKLRDRLKENGTMFIAVPNHESYDAKKYGEHWAGYDVPRHLWHFGKKPMSLLLSKHNFELLTILPMKLDAFYVSILSEKYKGTANIWGLPKGIITGLISNLRAGHNNYSSLIYVIRKK